MQLRSFLQRMDRCFPLQLVSAESGGRCLPEAAHPAEDGHRRAGFSRSRRRAPACPEARVTCWSADHELAEHRARWSAAPTAIKDAFTSLTGASKPHHVVDGNGVTLGILALWDACGGSVAQGGAHEGALEQALRGAPGYASADHRAQPGGRGGGDADDDVARTRRRISGSALSGHRVSGLHDDGTRGELQGVRDHRRKRLRRHPHDELRKRRRSAGGR